MPTFVRPLANIMFTAFTLVVGPPIASAIAQTPLCSADCLLTGGEKGDYFRFFAPPIVALLERAWVDAPIAKSPGTPASLDWLTAHPTSYALAQGDIFALTAKTDQGAKFRVVRGTGIGNEAVLAIASARIYARSQGSWGAIANHAKQVRFITGASDSGPAATFRSLQALDPANLGKGTIAYAADLDAAIQAVKDNRADVAFMVQFGNADNPRFKAIQEAGLKVVPVLAGAMKGLKMPDGSPAYTLCEGVNVGAEKPLITACTPIQLVTGAANDNADLGRVFAAVTEADFTPKDTGFARFWKAMVVKASTAAYAAFDAADKIAAKVID